MTVFFIQIIEKGEGNCFYFYSSTITLVVFNGHCAVTVRSLYGHCENSHKTIGAPKYWISYIACTPPGLGLHVGTRAGHDRDDINVSPGGDRRAVVIVDLRVSQCLKKRLSLPCQGCHSEKRLLTT